MNIGDRKSEILKDKCKMQTEDKKARKREVSK